MVSWPPEVQAAQDQLQALDDQMETAEPEDLPVLQHQQRKMTNRLEALKAEAMSARDGRQRSYCRHHLDHHRRRGFCV